MSALALYDDREALIAALIERVGAQDEAIATLTGHARLQDALIRTLSDRISKLEGVDPEPDRSGWTTIKGAAHEIGYSQSGLRKRIAAGKVAAQRLGGRWIIDRASLDSKCDKTR
jgi:hypothetical protein